MNLNRKIKYLHLENYRILLENKIKYMKNHRWEADAATMTKPFSNGIVNSKIHMETEVPEPEQRKQARKRKKKNVEDEEMPQ